MKENYNFVTPIEHSILNFYNFQTSQKKIKTKNKKDSIIDKENMSLEFNNSKENSKNFNDEKHEPSKLMYLEKLNNKNNKNISPEQTFKIEDLSNIIEHTKYINEIQNNSEYLKTRIISNINSLNLNDFKNYIINNFPIENISNLNQIISQKINFILFDEDRVIINNEPLGPFESLSSFIETKFQDIKNSIQIKKKKYEQFKNSIFKYRKINGDGNCFYRCVMIRFIEILIINEDIENLKNLIYDIIELYKNDKEIIKYLQINNFIRLKPELISIILILIFIILSEQGKELAYKIFITAILTCQIFDLGLILYLRFNLYKYIKNNENKMLSKKFPILIGNLLPENFVFNDKFDFKKFYEDYLLKMYQDAEKIVIYLIPFIFNIKLNIIMFENQNESEINLDFSGLNTTLINEEINVIITKLHYEIVYKQNDYENFKNIFKEYTINEKNKLYDFVEEKNNNYKSIIFKQSLNNNIINNNNNNYKNINNNNNNNNNNNDNNNNNNNIDKNNKYKNINNNDNNNLDKNNKDKNINNNNDNNNINNIDKNNKDKNINNNNNNNKKNNNNNIDKSNKDKNNKNNNNNNNNDINNNLEKINTNKDLNSKNKKNNDNNNNIVKNKTIISNETPLIDNCFICKLYNNKKKIICKECYKELKNSIFISYFNDYLLNVKNTKNQLTISSIHEEFKNKLFEIKGQKLTLLKWIDKIKLIEPGLTLEKLIDRLKYKSCIYCTNFFDSKEDGIQLPCKCRICSKKCLYKLVMKCLEISNEFEYMCFCSKIYTFTDIFDLSFYLYKYNFIDLYNVLIEILNSDSFCCLCNNYYQKIFYLIEYKLDLDKNYIESDLIIKYKSINRFNHYICEKCFIKYFNSIHHIFQCQICKLEHKIIKIIDINKKKEPKNKKNSSINKKNNNKYLKKK